MAPVVLTLVGGVMAIVGVAIVLGSGWPLICGGAVMFGLSFVLS